LTRFRRSFLAGTAARPRLQAPAAGGPAQEIAMDAVWIGIVLLFFCLLSEAVFRLLDRH
jgi:hypothetical protein